MLRSHVVTPTRRLAASAALTSLAILAVVALLTSVLVGVAYSADPPISPPVGPAQGDVACTGVVANVSVDNVVVPEGAVCVLAGTQVRGNVLAKPGSTLQVSPGTQVFGNVEAKQGARLFVSPSKFGGHVKCDGCLVVSISSSLIGGNLQSVGAAGAFVFRTDVGGNVEIVGTTGVAPVMLSQAVVGGDVKLEKNEVPLSVGGITVGGDLQSIEGRYGSLLFNFVEGNMQAFKNQGPLPTRISGNSIGQALQCHDNQPPPIVLINSAREREGQCA
jgi:hypothetical protein